MSGTPIRLKRGRSTSSSSSSRPKMNNRPTTTSSSSTSSGSTTTTTGPRKITMPAMATYNPPVSRLRRNYDVEFGKFLKSVKEITDFMEAQKQNYLIPTRRKLRANQKELSNLHLYFKSLAYWKTFYSQFIARNDDIMDCFRFEEATRDVTHVVASHALPVELVSFVTQQLIDWRRLFENDQWMKTFRELSEKLDAEKRKADELAERIELIREISLEIELCNLHIDDDAFESNSSGSEEPARVMARVAEAVETSKKAERWRRMPRLKRRYTKDWCKKHHAEEKVVGSSEEEEDSSSSSSDGGQSSIFGDGPDSTITDISSSADSTTVNDIDAFFQEHGL